MAVNRDLALRSWKAGIRWLMGIGPALAFLSVPASAEPQAQATASTSPQPPVPASAPAPVAPATDRTAAPSNSPQPTKVEGASTDPTPKKVRLDFEGQQWLPVLEWLAKTRNLNLDWQQLPQGTLNLASTNEYSVEEAEDLINMQLLARGFTLLERGGVLRVAPLKDLDVTLVSRVDAAELDTLPRHKFVRVTFPLNWMIADEAASEFKPLISPYGQLFPMASSNRLEAMDAVVNLRELQRLLTRAEADEGRRERVAEFRLKHRKADDVAVKVRQLLGLPADVTPTATSQNELDIATAKFRSEAVKTLGEAAQPLLKDKAEVRLVVSDKENSILVNGRPDKIEIARQAIEALDKPEPPSESSWEAFNKVKTYAVDGFDPAAITQVMQALQDRGNINKTTRIQYEATNNRLVVIGSPEDQLTIANIIESFGTERRRADVLPLGQIDAQYATKAIQLVLKNPARPASAPGLASEGQFQIEPDSTHNRLLLWATPAESAEVREFLARLGESSASVQSATPMHVVPLRGAKAEDVVQRLERVWKEISDAPLLVESGQKQAAPLESPVVAPAAATTPVAAAPASAPPIAAPQIAAPPIAAPAIAAPPVVVPAAPPAQVTPAAQPDPKAKPMSDRTAIRPAVLLVAQQLPVTPEAPTPQPASAPDAAVASAKNASPVRVIVDEEGELMIVSRDAAAAEAARQFVEQIVPPAADVQIITLKHAQAAVVKTQLDALLIHTRATDYSALNSKESLAIEADSRTNRLIIQHATPRQMQLIEKTVPLLDQPEQGDDRLVRQQRVYRAERKLASEIALVLKDVFRDLLSTSDKVFDARTSNRPFGYTSAMAATSKSPEYQGLLSIGVDEAGNMLVVSAPAYLMDEVMNVAKLVDTSSSTDSVVVVPVSRAARAKLGEALGRVLAKP
jgi:type II secretory pathway component GspD/PulD (secretin)